MQIAAHQHGLITLDQARELGLSRKQVDGRLARGDWERLQPGVFRVAGAPSTRMQSFAAVCLSSRSPVWLSHLTAAELHGLRVWQGDRIEVTCRSCDGVLRRRHVQCHVSGRLDDADVTVVNGLPVTSVARTLVDLGDHLTEASLAVVIDDAIRRRVTYISEVEAALARLGTRSGRKRRKSVQQTLSTRLDAPGTESHLEAQILRAIRAAGLPEPVQQFNVIVDGCRYRLDFAYPEHRVAIEVDGYAVHSTREQFDRDRTRDNALRLAGWTVLHFTSSSSEVVIARTIRGALTNRE